MKYLYLLFIPYPLNVYHKITFAQNFEPKVVLSVIAIVALLLLAIVLSKKQKIISFSIFWFFLSLAPVANVFPTGIIMAEKYAYLASISTCLILGWLVYLLIKADQKTVKITGLLIALAIAIFYGSLTYARNFDWKNDEALWLKTLSQRPDYGRVYNNLGFVYYKQRNLEKALAYLEKARELEPNLAIVYQNLGNTYDELGDYSQAIENYEKVIELFPDFAEGYNNLGVSFQKSGDLDEALENFQKAVEKDPSYFIAYSNIGVVYLITQDYPAAKEYFQKALEINPGYSLAKQGLLQVNELMR